MAYISGDIIRVADLNGFINTFNQVWGTGASTRGYGQTELASVLAAQKIGQEWKILRDKIEKAMLHQSGSVNSSLISGNELITTKKIKAHSSFTNVLDTSVSNLNSIDTNRLNAIDASMSIINLGSSVRTTPWGAGLSTITHEFSLNWTTQDTMRWFFNSGGQVRISLSRLAGSNTRSNLAWSTMFTTCGQIKFNYNQTSANHVVVPLGFYNMTTSFQTVMVNPTSTINLPNSFSVSSRKTGSILTFRIQLEDIDSSTGVYAAYGYGDIVDGVLTSIIECRKATTHLQNIETPIITTSINF